MKNLFSSLLVLSILDEFHGAFLAFLRGPALDFKDNFISIDLLQELLVIATNAFFVEFHSFRRELSQLLNNIFGFSEKVGVRNDSGNHLSGIGILSGEFAGKDEKFGGLKIGD